MAMTAVVAAGGTAAASAIKDIVFAGKTGSAQNSGGADHAWFAGFAPAADPKIVVAVFIEFGGHGPRAALIASSIVKYYLKGNVLTPIVTGN